MASYISTGGKINVKQSIINQEGTTLRQKAEQFRILKENFSRTGKYEDEDKAYIMFKRYEAKSWLTEQKEKGGIEKYSVIFLMDFSGLYLIRSDSMPLPRQGSVQCCYILVHFWICLFSDRLSGLGKQYHQ